VVGAKSAPGQRSERTQRTRKRARLASTFFWKFRRQLPDSSKRRPGFKKYLRKGIVVNLNEAMTLDIPLVVGGSTEIVEVTGAPPLVDTTSTQLGQW